MAESRRYKVIVSDRAKRMLGTHIRFMAQVNKDAAKAKKKEIMTAMRSLCQIPQRFPFFEELYITPNKYHKMFIEKWYLVLYQIQDDTVYVDYILDCRKDYSWLIR
ncbi:MAG: type II toxin-antitoxin system RelE/ParE family toxin [Lachnospiraceae bacterium]|jgi:plasmid stabilization system protein ParE|nr:type II toxin-antitoxin system RelE/ParE family toxin [Lachnospiraceae bacterium]